MHRKTIRWAGLALALLGLTCRDNDLIGPGGSARAAFDVSAFALFAPGDPPVPAESLEVVFRRTDETIALADTIDLAAAAQGDSFVVPVDVPLDDTPQDFMLALRAFGGGVDWYAAGGPVTLVQGANDPVAPPVTYVGPGANADSVRLQMPTTRLVGGVAVPLAATVYGPGGTVVTGVPVGFRVGNGAVASVSGALLNTATVTGAQPTTRDSTWVYAETPTHLRDSVRVRVVPPPAQLVAVSGDAQAGPPGVPLAAPFVVRVLDALGDPFPGDTVTWVVSAGTGALSAASTVTDSGGYASVTLTPVSLGAITVQASAPGLSPRTFTATGTGGNAITIVSGNAQSDTAAATLQPFVVRVADGQNNPVAGAQVSWTRFVGAGSLSAATTATGGTGQTQVTYTLGTVPGADSVRAQLVGSPANVVFGATTLPGTLGSVTLDRTRDTIAKGATLQYTATLRDAQGNVVPGTPTWSSTAPAVATVSQTGLATAVAGGYTRVIAAAGGRADTADLYVRALATIVARPADTVITAIGDSLLLGATALTNFGDTITTGLVIRYSSATPTVATVNAVTGRVHIVGAGNAVVLVRDSVSGIQGAGTLRVNQVPAAVANTPADSIQVGVSGRGQIVARAFDRNNYPIPGRTFGWTTRAPGIATVDQSGVVTGVALGATWVVDSLVDSAGVFKDSTLVSVVTLPPALVQWAYDSTAVGNGSSLAVAISLTRTSPTPVVIRMTSSDTVIAKPTVRLVTIPANSPGTSATINGLAAGRVDIVAVDTAGVYLPDTMTVTVVSTIEFRETGSFSRQQYFYLNNNQTHRAQVFLSDPAPAGGLGVTFVYGAPGKSVVVPSPALIPAGQLSADVVLQGIGAGRDSVVPTSGGFVGRFAYVYVAPESLRLQLPYPYTGVLGAGQSFDPYVYYTYGMDHPQVVALTLSPVIGTVPDTVTVPRDYYYRYFTVRGTTLGRATLTASAPGWISDTATVTVSTPRLYSFGSTSIVAGDPTLGYWYAYARDSLNYEHNVTAPLVVTAVSRNPAAVVVAVTADTIPVGSYQAYSGSALRALPGAGGDSAWVVFTAPGYRPDSFLVHVTRPTLTYQIGYPYTGRVPLGTRHTNAAYVSIPYVRSDTLWVLLSHTRRGVLGGPDSVAILPGQTYRYIDLQGDSLGVDTVAVARATGYVVSGGPFGYQVGPLRVRPYSYPTTLYTISARQLVSASAEDSATGYTGYYTLLAPLTVALVSRNPSAFTLDSGRVVIPAGTWVSGYDTLRVVGVDTVGVRIVASAPAAASDSSGLIRVYPTPLNVQIGYPYQVGQGLRLESNRVYVTGGNVPDTVRVALTHTNAAGFAIGRDTVIIPRGVQYSDLFDIRGIDSVGTDTIIATAVGYVTARGSLPTQPSRLDVIDPGANHVTTEPPYRMTTYVGIRNGVYLSPSAPVTFTIVSSDPSVIRIDSAATVNATGDTATGVIDTFHNYQYFRVRFVGSGTARLRVSAPGFDLDSTYLITVTGPSLNLSYTSLTVGQGQIFTLQRVYVNNPVTSPLVVRLLRSDSLLTPGSRAFALAADSVVIAAGQTYSPYFDITGNAIGSANLVARANGYSQATSVVSVGQPRLQASAQAVTLYAGEQPRTITVSTLDQSGSTRIVASGLVVAAAASDTAIAKPDSASRTLAVRQSTTSFALRPRRKGSVDVVYTASGYTPDTTVVTVDTAKLGLLNPPTALGPGQIARTTMYVQLPYYTDSALVVSLASTNTSVLTVPTVATILAGSNYTYFDVTGVGIGVASIIVTAPHSYPDTQAVRISRPRLAVAITSAVNAGQRYTFTVTAQDSLGTARLVAAPLAVTFTSSNPSRTHFDSLTTTIAAGQSSVSTMGVSFDTAGVYVITASATGYDPGSGTTTATGALVRMVSGNLFAPQTVTIPAGRIITWRNDDTITHTTTADGATPLWNSGNRTPGQTYQRTFSTAGTFTYHCSIHPGMTGTIVVQ